MISNSLTNSISAPLCRSFRDLRNSQLDEADAQLTAKPPSNLLKRLNRGISVAVFKPAQVRLFKAASLGKLLLSQPLGKTSLNDASHDLSLRLLSVPFSFEVWVLEFSSEMLSEVTHR